MRQAPAAAATSFLAGHSDAVPGHAPAPAPAPVGLSKQLLVPRARVRACDCASIFRAFCPHGYLSLGQGSSSADTASPDSALSLTLTLVRCSSRSRRTVKVPLILLLLRSLSHRWRPSLFDASFFSCGRSHLFERAALWPSPQTKGLEGNMFTWSWMNNL